MPVLDAKAALSTNDGDAGADVDSHRANAQVEMTLPDANDDHNSSQRTAVRAASLAKQVDIANARIVAERVQLQRRADELRQKLDETARELDAVQSRREALDKDEAFFSAMMDRTFTDLADYFADRHLALNPAGSASTVSLATLAMHSCFTPVNINHIIRMQIAGSDLIGRVDHASRMHYYLLRRLTIWLKLRSTSIELVPRLIVEPTRLLSSNELLSLLPPAQ
jgi:hypothetical protein